MYQLASIEAIEMPLENAFPHRRWCPPNRPPWRAVPPVRRGASIGRAIGERRVWRHRGCLVTVAKSWLRPREGSAERETAQDARSTLMTVTGEWVHRLRAGSPRSRRATMDCAKRSRVRFLSIIVIKNRATANRVNGAPSERERLRRTRLLIHEVGEEGGCGGNGRDFGWVRVERGLDRVGRGSVGAIGGE
jgi:hypothetical protein